MQVREILIGIYLEWFNSYLTYATFAADHDLTTEQAEALINLAREVHNSPHPEA